MGWAHHPRGGIIVDVLGGVTRMPWGPERKLGPFGMSSALVYHLDDLPPGRSIYCVGKQARVNLGITNNPAMTDEVIRAWEASKNR
jgi:hypothetical protein